MVVFGEFGRSSGREPEAEVIQSVRAYWESLRDNGRLPLRQDIDPRGLASALEQVFLVEQIAPGHGRFRLAGNLFHDLMGMDVRGMPLTTLLEAASRERFKIGLQGVFEDAAGLHVRLEAERAIGRPALTARMLLLPLRASASEPMLALGVLACRGLIGRAPRRFAISSIRTEVVLQTEVTSRIARRGDPALQPAPPQGAEAKPRQQPALRLVHSLEDVRR